MIAKHIKHYTTVWQNCQSGETFSPQTQIISVFNLWYVYICHHFLLILKCVLAAHTAGPWLEKAKVIWNHWKKISPSLHEFYVVSHTRLVCSNTLVAIETKSVVSKCQFCIPLLYDLSP